MTQEDKELLLKDLAARIPYGVKAEVTEAYWHRKNVPIEPTIKVFTAFDYDQYACGKYYQVGVSQSCIISVKPYLRPMSSMTEEEHCKYAEMMWVLNTGISSGNSFIGVIVDDIDWLLAHHFDYRGLLSTGLALEAPKGMYNFEEED